MAQGDDLNLVLRIEAKAKRAVAELRAVGKTLKEQVGQGARNAAAETKKAGDSILAFASRAKLAILGVVAAMGALATKTASAGATAEDMAASLEIAEGSAEAAAKKFAELDREARRLRLNTATLVDAYTRLRNLGLNPTRDALEAYLNITAGTRGKQLEDVIEAVADAAVGEFERLKEFGIKAGIEGDKVSIRFRGARELIENDANAIQEALIRIGAVEFGGAFARRSETASRGMEGLVSSVTRLLSKINEETGLTASLGAAANGLRAVLEASTETTDSLDKLEETTGGLTFADRIEQTFTQFASFIRRQRGLAPIDVLPGESEQDRFTRWNRELLRLYDERRRLLARVAELERLPFDFLGIRDRGLRRLNEALAETETQTKALEKAVSEMENPFAQAGQAGAEAMESVGDAAEVSETKVRRLLAGATDALDAFAEETADLLGSLDAIRDRFEPDDFKATATDVVNALNDGFQALRAGRLDDALTSVRTGRDALEAMGDAGDASADTIVHYAERLRELAVQVQRTRAESGALFDNAETDRELDAFQAKWDAVKRLIPELDFDTFKAQAGELQSWLNANPLVVPVVTQTTGNARISAGGRTVTEADIGAQDTAAPVLQSSSFEDLRREVLKRADRVGP